MSDWKDVQIHFGKNKGLRLQDLTGPQLAWYNENVTGQDYTDKGGQLRRASQQDIDLRSALDEAQNDQTERPQARPSPRPVNGPPALPAPARPVPPREVPNRPPVASQERNTGKPTFEDMADLYHACYLAAAGNYADDQARAAAVATLFIQCSQQGIRPGVLQRPAPQSGRTTETVPQEDNIEF